MFSSFFSSSGKSASLGHKQAGPSSQWSELSISRAPRVSQFAVGHEGQHALVMSEAGEVFFAGTARRGEDGDQSGKASRRQPKPAKPKKMAKAEGISVVQVRETRSDIHLPST